MSTDVMIFMPQGKVSGAEAVLLELLRSPERDRVCVACPPGSELERRLQAEGTRTVAFGLQKLSGRSGYVHFIAGLVRSVVQAAGCLRAERPAVAHVFLPVAL